MPNQQIFCNAPWYELQIYWDGSLGFCCQENHKIYPDSQQQQYNVRNMSIKQWFDSEPMRQARLDMFGDKKLSICHRCYFEEQHGDTSRRHRSNQKSVIFTKRNFNESYDQSPGWEKFEHSRLNQGAYSSMPIDLHIDLGNYCNLTCKMCRPVASSSIAAQYVKWGIQDTKQYIGTDWTRDDAVWNRVLAELVAIPNLTNVHFMGGETLITPRFEDFVDFMIEHQRFDLNFSFVTNGTTFNESLINKLKKFKRVGIEVSIETTTEHNAYQRQGTDTDLVLSNIDRYLTHCNQTNITLTVRPAISLLTVGNYDTLLKYCYEKQLIVKSLPVFSPSYLDVRILPNHVRELYQQKYHKLIGDLDLESVDCSADYNESDLNQLPLIIKNQIQQCLNLLSAPRLDNADKLVDELVTWCKRWDQVHGYDALKLYPELYKEFVDRGY
jgi:MoaA/NifB/PqqE/SkfB family radical SAM enzyme